jgi:hypothetical protein
LNGKSDEFSQAAVPYSAKQHCLFDLRQDNQRKRYKNVTLSLMLIVAKTCI